MVGKYGVHEFQVGGTNIIEVEGHDILVVVVVIRHEGNFVGIHGSI